MLAQILTFILSILILVAIGVYHKKKNELKRFFCYFGVCAITTLIFEAIKYLIAYLTR